MTGVQTCALPIYEASITLIPNQTPLYQTRQGTWSQVPPNRPSITLTNAPISLQAWIAMGCLPLPEGAPYPWSSHPDGAPRSHHRALHPQPWGPADAHGHGRPRSTTQNSSMCLTRAWLGRWCGRATPGGGGVSGAVVVCVCVHVCAYVCLCEIGRAHV